MTIQVGGQGESQAIPLARSEGDHCVAGKPVIVVIHDEQLSCKAVGVGWLIYVGCKSLACLRIVCQVGSPDRDIGIIVIREIRQGYL